MFENSHIPNSIKNWNIDYDPYEFIKNENWLINADKTEDILQIKHSKLDITIDVGCYGKLRCYKIYVIYNCDWEKPKETFESDKIELITKKLYILIEKYKNG